MGDESVVDVEREGPVARIFLNRPEKANALNSGALEKLRDALRALEKDETLRVAVLAGRGRTFCGGADTQELRTLNAETAAPFVTRIHPVGRRGRGSTRGGRWNGGWSKKYVQTWKRDWRPF